VGVGRSIRSVIIQIKNMKKIAFFLSASDISEEFRTPALELVKLIVTAGYGFIYGGTDTGLMRESAELVESLHDISFF